MLYHTRGALRGLAVACWTTDHYHPCSNLGVGISEGCFVFHFDIYFNTHRNCCPSLSHLRSGRDIERYLQNRNIYFLFNNGGLYLNIRFEES